jgi:hypothetical protein
LIVALYLVIAYCADAPFVLQVLNARDDMIGVERMEMDADGKALLKARRSAGSMSAFSGAGGMVYMEYRCCLSPIGLYFLFNFNYNIYFTEFTSVMFVQHWEGCSQETQGPVKEASSVQETVPVGVL